jgi:hypothetical protein
VREHTRLHDSGIVSLEHCTNESAHIGLPFTFTFCFRNGAEPPVYLAVDIDALHRDTMLMSGVANDFRRPRRLLGSTLQRDFLRGLPAACRVPLSHPPISVLERRGRSVKGHQTASTPGPALRERIARGNSSQRQDAFAKALPVPSQYTRNNRPPRGTWSGGTSKK